jgi:cytochrome c oxidase subunit 3
MAGEAMAVDLLEAKPLGPAPSSGGTVLPPRAPSAEGSPDGPHGLLGDPPRFGLLAFLGTISMMFIGLTSAYLVRRTAADWRPLPAPAILWWNTGALLLSSVVLEGARRGLRRVDLITARRAMGAAGLLGLTFAFGQFQAWRILTAQGLSLASNPHSSFFYVLSGLHVVHLSGGLIWWGVAFRRLHRLAFAPEQDALRLFATYWHFLAALWLYLLYVLFVL